MNARILYRALLAPWLASHKHTRWLMRFVVAGSFVLCAGLGVFLQPADHAWPMVFALMPAAALAWMFFLPNMILLSRQARALCLPGIQRDVVYGLVLYALLTTLVPTLVLAGLAGTPILASALLLALAGLAGLLYAISPWVVSLLLCFSPALFSRTGLFSGLAPPGSPGFVLWAVPVTAMLLALAAYRWRHLSIHRVNMNGLMRPVIVALNANLRESLSGAGGTWHASAMDPVQLLRQRPTWLQPVADLRRCGPDHPRRALRVALGGSWVPQRPWEALRRFVLSLVFLVPSVLLFALVMMADSHASGGLAHVLGIFTMNAVSVASVELLLAFVGLITAISAGVTLRQQWRRTNREVPLLALLPGLGHAAEARRHLLRAVIGKPFGLLLALTGLMLLVGAWAHLPPAAMSSLALVGPGCMLFMLADALQTLGNTSPVHVFFMHWLMYPLAIMLSLIGAFLPTMIIGADGSTLSLQLTDGALGLGWIIFLALASIALLSGLKAFRERPHPYLPCA